MKSYPVASEYLFKRAFGKRHVRAVPTGEKRKPKKGEWYLSGAIVEAYLAPADLNHPFHICKIHFAHKPEPIWIIDEEIPAV